MNVYAIMNVTTMQRRGNYVNISMNVFGNKDALMVQRRVFHANISTNVYSITNVVTIQRRGFYAYIPMNVFCNKNALMVQRRRCCSFDSPGLARNEPTLGKHSQGDSTL